MNRLDRLDTEERYTQLAADAICRRHPQALWLARTRPSVLTDDTILAACERLSRWLAEHDSYPDKEGV